MCCRWIYKTKQKPDGSVDHFKAPLVARGFNQREDIDYDETFSPIVKLVTIHTILHIVVSPSGRFTKQMLKILFFMDFLKWKCICSRHLDFFIHLVQPMSVLCVSHSMALSSTASMVFAPELLSLYS